MRGTQTGRDRLNRFLRFIPAHAGNTHLLFLLESDTSVHPRACGEHSLRLTLRVSGDGSSPRMRGTPLLMARAKSILRFIPAHAGNTRCGINHEHRNPVHPRACGEHVALTVSLSLTVGSSPRMRGTLKRKSFDGRSKRFIPAHAGNTDRAVEGNALDAVHPRACGEHAKRNREQP